MLAPTVLKHFFVFSYANKVPAVGISERQAKMGALFSAGVGLVFDVDDQPNTVDVVGTEGTQYTIAWSSSASSARDEFEDIVSGELRDGTTRMQLAEKDGGVWLLWFTDLPEQEDGVFYTVIEEVVFRSGSSV